MCRVSNVPDEAPILPRLVPMIRTDSAGRIAADLPCHQCGYNLRGLTLTGLCPECGQPVRTALEEPWLWEAPATWVYQVRVGLFLGLFGLIASLLCGVPLAESRLSCPAAQMAFVLSLLCWATGTWLAMAPEPIVAPVDLARPIARWVSLVPLLAQGLCLAFMAAGPAGGTSQRLWCEAITWLAFLLSWLCQLRTLNYFAHRLALPCTTARAAMLPWFLGASVLLAFLGLVPQVATGRGGGVPGCLLTLAIPGIILHSLQAIIVQWRVARRLHRAIGESVPVPSGGTSADSHNP